MDIWGGWFNGVQEVLILCAVKRGILVCVALASGALVACSDPRAGTLPSPTSTAAPTTSATPSATPDPAAEVRQALRAYFDALYAAGLDPANKTDELAELIHDSCSCRAVVGLLKEQARRNRHVDYTYTLRDVRVIEASSRSGTVRYTVRQSAGALRDASGRAIERYPLMTSHYTARFTNDHGRWTLERLDEFK